MSILYGGEVNDRLQTLDAHEASAFVHQDALRTHRHKRLITEVYPHPIRKNAASGKHHYFEGLTYRFLANFPESQGLDVMSDGVPVITFTASMRHRDFADRSKFDSLLFTGDPSCEAWDQPAKRTPFVYCAPVAVPALGADTIIARGVYLVEKDKGLTYSPDDGKCIWAYCRSDDRGHTWGEIIPQPLLDDGRDGAGDLCHQPWVEGADLTFGLAIPREPASGDEYPDGRLNGQTILRTYHADKNTWDEPVFLPAEWCTSECSVVRAQNGDLVVALRHKDPSIPSENDGWRNIVTSWSSDNGRTWAEPQAFFRFGRVHANITVLPDGRLVMTHAARIGELDRRIYGGVEAVVSEDHGRTWDWDGRYILFRCPQGFKLFNPRTVRLADGRLMTAIYNYTTYTWTDLKKEDAPENWNDTLLLPHANYLGLGNVMVVIWELQD
ncbi:MAG: hypothetical protein CMJ49_08285 [Planctomycetaceae bacterium]|nr:hypothetical protein [Planctomycetaceae bacterium]